MEKNELKNIIECLLYVSAKPVSVKKFADVLETGVKEIEQIVIELQKDYETANKSIFIQNVAGGWRMATKQKYGEWVKKLFSREMTHRLSNAALEALAIIAYRQPVTIQEIEVIRGVSTGGVLRGLLEKGLIKIAGRKEAIGRPVLYRTTDKFLEYFGLESISDIPPLEELGIEKEIEELVGEDEPETQELDLKDASAGEEQQPESEDVQADSEAQQETKTADVEESDDEIITDEADADLKDEAGEIEELSEEEKSDSEEPIDGKNTSEDR
jgi:segregation and condensation protein B